MKAMERHWQVGDVVRDTSRHNLVATGLNQYEAIITGGVTNALAYDAWGNLTDTSPFRFTYSYAGNLLVGVDTNRANGVRSYADYDYDAQSRRAYKYVYPPSGPNRSHWYFYSGWSLQTEQWRQGNSAPYNFVHYVWGRDLSGTLDGAGGVGGLLATEVGGTWYFPLYDNNGNVTDYVSETGEVMASYAYDAFGRTLSATGSMSSVFPFRFSTKYYDAETGLYYYGYRYYSPELGRWLTRDPIEEDGGDNLYAFCENNGVDKFDKLGLVSFCDCINVVSLEVRYKKAWWKYMGHILSEPRYTEALTSNLIKKKKDNCDTAYMLELTIEPKGGRDMLVNQNHPENAEGKPCKLLTGNEFKQNFGPPRKEQRYWPVVTFEVTGEKKVMRLWEGYITFKGEYGINSIATRYLEQLPSGSKIKITAQIDSRELDQPEAISSFGTDGVREVTLK